MIINTAIFQQTIETAKAKSANNPAMLRAIERATVEINKSKYWAYDLATNVLRIQSTTSSKLYIVDDSHTCEANSKTCKHFVARRLLQRYSEACAVASITVTVQPALPPQVQAQPAAPSLNERVIVVSNFGRNHRVVFPYKHDIGWRGFKQVGMWFKEPHNVGGIEGQTYWVIPYDKLTAALDVIRYWYTENPLTGESPCSVSVAKVEAIPPPFPEKMLNWGVDVFRGVPRGRARRYQREF